MKGLAHQPTRTRRQGTLAKAVPCRSALRYPRAECVRTPAAPLACVAGTGSFSRRSAVGGKSALRRAHSADRGIAVTAISGASADAADAPARYSGRDYAVDGVGFAADIAPGAGLCGRCGKQGRMIASPHERLGAGAARVAVIAPFYRIQISGTTGLFQRRNAGAEALSALTRCRVPGSPEGAVVVVTDKCGWGARTSRVEHMQRKYFSFLSEYIAALRETWLHFYQSSR